MISLLLLLSSQSVRIRQQTKKKIAASCVVQSSVQKQRFVLLANDTIYDYYTTTATKKTRRGKRIGERGKEEESTTRWCGTVQYSTVERRTVQYYCNTTKMSLMTSSLSTRASQPACPKKWRCFIWQ
jgi:hypothetical protein